MLLFRFERTEAQKPELSAKKFRFLIIQFVSKLKIDCPEKPETVFFSLDKARAPPNRDQTGSRNEPIFIR